MKRMEKKCPRRSVVRLGQVGYVPPAAEGFDQQHRSVHPVAEDGSRGSFDRRRLRSDNFVQNQRPPYQQVVVVNLWFLTFAPAVAIPRSGLRFLAPG
jgi:hypothetical protein